MVAITTYTGHGLKRVSLRHCTHSTIQTPVITAAVSTGRCESVSNIFSLVDKLRGAVRNRKSGCQRTTASAAAGIVRSPLSRLYGGPHQKLLTTGSRIRVIRPSLIRSSGHPYKNLRSPQSKLLFSLSFTPKQSTPFLYQYILHHISPYRPCVNYPTQWLSPFRQCCPSRRNQMLFTEPAQ